MAQTPPTFCPQCDAPVKAGHRFCANCGLVLAGPPVDGESAPELLPTRPLGQPQAPDAVMPQGQTSWRSGPPSALPQLPKKRSFGRAGVVLVLLLVLLLLGVGVYFASGFMGVHIPGLSSGPGAQSTVTTTQLNTTLTYAGADLTILTAQQAQSFADDPNSAADGMVRLNIQEQDKTSSQMNLAYNDIARLKLPGKNAEVPTYVKAKGSIAPGSTQFSSIDFAVPTDVKVNQLTLVLGSATEAQLEIPLTGHANLSRYASRTVSLHGQMTYLGLNYTLVSVASQWSMAGQQTSKGMVYIVVTLKVDNTLSQQAIPGSAYDYIRLKAGNSSATPVDTTLPTAFDTGEMGKTGTVTFLMPQGSSAFTLILLSQGGSDQATSDFQLA